MPFTIPTGLVSVYQDMGDALLEFGNFRKVHKVVYPPRLVSCINCVTSTIGGISTNTYKSGGPAPFNGSCPLCGGNAYREEEV